MHLSTFKEREQKFYPFPDEDVPNMLEQLLQTKVIKLPECKQSEEMEKVDNPNYCKYHCIICHPVQKCFMLKEIIMKLAKEKKIDLDYDEVAEANHTTIACGSPNNVLPTLKQGALPLNLVDQKSRGPENKPHMQSKKEYKKLGTTKVKVQYDHLLPQKFKNHVTLLDLFPQRLSQNYSMEIIHMVSCYEIHNEEHNSKPSPNHNTPLRYMPKKPVQRSARRHDTMKATNGLNQEGAKFLA